SLRARAALLQRAAADALATHAVPENVAPLLRLRHSLPADDTHLLYMVRLALRNQLRPSETWAKLASSSWSKEDRRAVAGVCLGIPSAEAAEFLLAQLARHVSEERGRVPEYVHHVARYGVEDKAATLLEFARKDEAGDLLHQAALFKAIQQGTQERGGRLGA